MRNELNRIEQIERYLRKEMGAEELNAFEKEIKADAKLREEVRLQEEVIKGLKHIALKQQAKKAYKKHTIGKGLKKWGGIGGTLVLLAAAAYVGYQKFSGTKNDSNLSYELPELNENGEKIWADADKYLPYQLFDINNAHDTVIETLDGIVMAIPAGCFLDKNGKPVNGNVQLEVKEAIESNDILKAGLNTRSGDQLLETGGMFYLNARKDGESLGIDPNKGVHTEVPTNEVKAGMQLYEGKRMPDGNIDWVAPKPLEKFLLPVDIYSLNFYPPDYEDSLAGMKPTRAQEKLYKDSLYYSFAYLFDEKFNGIELKEVETEAVSKDKQLYDALKTDTTSSDVLSNTSFTEPVFDKHYSNISRKQRNEIYEGLWKKYDPAIYSITGIESSGGDEKDNLSMSILIYRKEIQGINPSKVKAIWNNKFNNTLLATREFAERMPYIHRSCNNNILDLYVNNLDKKLCTIDSMAAEMAGGKFRDFAARGDGRVKTDNAGHLEKLKKYYAGKSKAFTEAAAKTEKAFWEKHQKAQEKYNAAETKFNAKDIKREQDNFIKEFNLNYDEACRQLGYVKLNQIPKAAYVVNVTTAGWKNLDQAVLESTLTRTTLDYTDPFNGSKAVIKYEELTVTVKDRDNYDALFVYMVPDKLDSYMRLKETSKVFTEKLNELMQHEMVCVAYKGEKAFFKYMDGIKPGKYENVELAEVSKDELDNRLKLIKKFKHEQSLLNELSFRHVQQKENIRFKKVQDLVDFRDRMQKVVFPCERDAGMVDTASVAMPMLTPSGNH